MDSTRRAFDPWLDRLDLGYRSLVDQYLPPGWEEDAYFPPTNRYIPRYRSRFLRTGPDRDVVVTDKPSSKDSFTVKLDVHQFAPEEVTVKSRDNNLIIEGKHEEREDSEGFISRQFSRRYVLPEDINIENMVCNMSSDGVLSVEAPKKSVQPGGEKMIPIRQTGRPAVVTATPKAQPTPSGGTTPTPGVDKDKDTKGQQGQQDRKEGKSIPIERETSQQTPQSS